MADVEPDRSHHRPEPSDRRTPEVFEVAVLVDRRPSRVTRWREFDWSASGVVAHSDPGSTEPRRIRAEDGLEQFLWPGFELALYRDEAESYHYNISSDAPSLFVVCRMEDDERPVPFAVTAAHDEAEAYMEGEETVYKVPMPPEIYRWVEAYVLANFTPRQRKKRKRENWSGDSR
jgi:hypothetical protein